MATDLKLEPIQSLWIGTGLSKVEQLCIRSFLDNGHEFHLYTYGQLENVPGGTTVFDANTIIPEDKIFRFEEGWAKGSVSGFADVFRLQLLKTNGGWWVDMDIICLKPFCFPPGLVFCSSDEGIYGSCANNCVIHVPQNSDFIDHCLKELEGVDLTKMTFGSAGPFLFQKVIKELKLEEHIVPYCYFNPISWNYIGELALGKLNIKGQIKEYLRPLFKPKTMPGRRIKPESFAVHLWNEVWRAAGDDKNGSYNKKSLFEKLKRKHGIK